MRKFAIPILLIVATPWTWAAKPTVTQMVTVAQLEKFLSANRGLKDSNLAKQIVDMKLTERLSDAEEERLAKELLGKKSQLAFLAIADESAFLDPPAEEIPKLPPPDHATQTALINKAIDYAIKTTRAWPNFMATRVTTRVEIYPIIDPPFRYPNPDDYPRKLMKGKTTSVGVLYRNGHEEYANGRRGLDQECAAATGFSSATEFGEVLGHAAYEATQGTVKWSHWEQGPNGLLAAFRYAAKVIYKFPTICPRQLKTPPTLLTVHGEMAVDPANGSILRLTNVERFQEESGEIDTTEEFGVAETYGPVEIGGRNYLCPKKSVAIDLQPIFSSQANMSDFDRQRGLSQDPLTEGLNHQKFINPW